MTGHDKEIGMSNLSQIRENTDEKFYAVTLDGRVIKSLYKDPLYIPSRALALAVAEEWEHQQDTIDMRTMHVNTMLAKSVKVKVDPSLEVYMTKEIIKVLGND